MLGIATVTKGGWVWFCERAIVLFVISRLDLNLSVKIFWLYL